MNVIIEMFKILNFTNIVDITGEILLGCVIFGPYLLGLTLLFLLIKFIKNGFNI